MAPAGTGGPKSGIPPGPFMGPPGTMGPPPTPILGPREAGVAPKLGRKVLLCSFRRLPGVRDVSSMPRVLHNTFNRGYK